MKKQVGRAPSLAKAAITGTGAAVIWAVVCAAVIAKLLDSEVMKIESVGYGSMVAHISAVFLGARIAMGGAGHIAQTAAIATGAAYFLCLLMINALFFGGHFEGLGTTLILTGIATAAALLTGKGRNRTGHRHYKIPK